jgi:hypothetical protein
MKDRLFALFAKLDNHIWEMVIFWGGYIIAGCIIK